MNKDRRRFCREDKIALENTGAGKINHYGNGDHQVGQGDG